MHRSGRDAGLVCDTGKKSAWQRGKQGAVREGSPTPHIPSDHPCSPSLHELEVNSSLSIRSQPGAELQGSEQMWLSSKTGHGLAMPEAKTNKSGRIRAGQHILEVQKHLLRNLLLSCLSCLLTKNAEQNFGQLSLPFLRNTGINLPLFTKSH